MVLFEHVQGFMAQMLIVLGNICGMNWLVFSNIGMLLGVALGIST